MAQLGLTLLHFALVGTTVVAEDVMLPLVRATHIHYAAFLTPVIPGDLLTLHAKVVECGLTMVAAGQAFTKGSLAACMVAEVYLEE
jgi:3-hydroxymyristoyl/3-hydroxydecanoyl-(acyl carrier protein) dehydratase